MAVLTKNDLPQYTYDDYQRWEGDWELIEGIPYAIAPAPVKDHQLLVLAIGSELLAKIGECPECEVLIDEDWKLDSTTVLKPDISVVCNDENPNYITKTPEIIFEVLSPSTAKRDEGLKFNRYQVEIVKYYILVYPETLNATIYKHTGKELKKAAECNSETFAFDEVSCPFDLDFSVIFKRLRKRS